MKQFPLCRAFNMIICRHVSKRQSLPESFSAVSVQWTDSEKVPSRNFHLMAGQHIFKLYWTKIKQTQNGHIKVALDSFKSAVAVTLVTVLNGLF